MKNLTLENTFLVSGASDACDDCKQEIKDKADHAKDNAKDVVNDVLEDIGDGANTAAEKINNLVVKSK